MVLEVVQAFDLLLQVSWWEAQAVLSVPFPLYRWLSGWALLGEVRQVVEAAAERVLVRPLLLRKLQASIQMHLFDCSCKATSL